MGNRLSSRLESVASRLLYSVEFSANLSVGSAPSDRDLRFSLDPNGKKIPVDSQKQGLHRAIVCSSSAHNHEVNVNS